MKIQEKFLLFFSNRALRSGALFSIFSFVNRGFSFFLLLILANYITPEEYGYLSLFNTVVMVIGYFAAFSSEGFLSVSFFQEGFIGAKKTVSCILATACITFFIFMLLIFLFGGDVSFFLNISLHNIAIAVIICYLTLFTNIVLDWLRLRDKVISYGMLSCSNALINFTLSIILVRFCSLGWEGRVYAQTSCFVLYGFFCLAVLFWKKMVALPNFSHWKIILLWGMPLIPHLATNFIRQGCDRYIINYNHSISDVGLFSFALNLANIIIMVGMGFNQSNSVEIYKILGNRALSSFEKKTALVAQTKILFGVYFAISLIFFLIIYFVMPIILPKYQPAMNYFAILSIYGFLQCLYFLFVNFLFFLKKTKKIMGITFSSSIIHLLLSLLLTPYSLYYTCMIYCMTQFFILILVAYMSKKELNKFL